MAKQIFGRYRPGAISAIAIGASLAFQLCAQAEEPAIDALGQTGGLVIPYGFTLPEGMTEMQYNNYIDPQYGKRTVAAQNYWATVGLLPYVELSGGLSNYASDSPAPFTHAEHFLFRHLSGDIKVQVPKFFSYQPMIAFGATDLGGQSHSFRSEYGVISQNLGPVLLTAGYGHGQRLDGLFGGAQLSILNTGLALLAEDDSKTPYVGVRYQSPRVSWLADANVVATLTRAVRSTDGISPRTSVSIGVQIPLGKRFTETRCSPLTCEGAMASNGTASNEISGGDAPIADSRSATRNDAALNDGTTTLAGTPLTVPYAAKRTTSVLLDQLEDVKAPVTPSVPNVLERASLDQIAQLLFQTGLERVRVGMSGRDLIVEYENHRYNQNEADALGIVLGVASVDAPPGTEKIRVVIKKANEPLGEVTVDRAAFAQFIEGGSATSASASLTMSNRPTYDADAIAWHGNEHTHGLTRIQIEPVVSYLLGTDYGVFDISLGANIQAFVPLWRGAEFYASYFAPIYNTKNMDDGRVYANYRLPGGLTSLELSQSFWIAPGVLNVASVGKFDYSYLGAENETTVFVPGRSDLIRLRLAYLHHEPAHDQLPSETNALLTYRWVQPSWKLWIEGGVARFVGGDKGPLLTFTRWFDDVSVSLHAEHSGAGSFVGATVSFPLTPRQGMEPGITQIDGSQQFALDIRTRVGSVNYLTQTGDGSISYAYSSQKLLLNQGRFSGEYFATQLYRMRDAYLRYAAPKHESTQQNPQPDAWLSRTGSVSVSGSD